MRDLNQGTIEYPVSVNYRKNWGDWEAVREIYQNAVDAGDKVSLRKTAKGLVIKDDGPGMELHNLLIGESSKDGVSTIGKFGEGMKFGLLCLLRENRTVKIQSNGLVLKPRLQEMFDRQVLAIDYSTAPESYHGTKVVIHGVKESFADRFLKTNDNFQDKILLNKPGKLFIKGIYTRDIDSDFGYNLNMERENPITGDTDMDTVKWRISQLMEKASNTGYLEYLAEIVANMDGTMLEASCGWWSSWNFKSRNTLARLVRKAVGSEKICYYSSPEASNTAEYHGYKVMPIDISFIKGIFNPDKMVVANVPAVRGKLVPKDCMSQVNRNKLRKCRKLFMKIFDLDMLDIRVMDWPANPERLGSTRYQQYICLSKNIIGDASEILETMAHEIVHYVWGHDDMTRDFMNAQAVVSAKIMKELM